MTIPDWVDDANDIVAGWYEIFSGRQVPVGSPQSTDTSVMLAQNRQQQQTLLIMGGVAIIAVLLLRSK